MRPYLHFEDSADGRQAFLNPVFGSNHRYSLVEASRDLDEHSMRALTVNGGGILHAHAPGLYAWGDARIFVERQEPYLHSYDGQYVEPAEAGENSIATFVSFARFEGRMTLDTKYGRIGVGRHRQHIGPAYKYPLILGQWTQPYSHVDWSMEWGKFRLKTLWAALSIDGVLEFRADTATRSLYAHRYEWSPFSWFDLGVTEALILYQTQEPIAFVPIVPLFMMKGQSVEKYANGELAFDAQVRPFNGLRVYAEFLIDDMSEPTSLFNDFWKNRWGVTAGTQASFPLWREVENGVIFEISRVEPWVYTEYAPNTNQAVHQGVPLGNPNGPNSLSISGTAYGTFRKAALSVGLEWVRKGSDSGSFLEHFRPESSQAQKTFLAEPTEHAFLNADISVPLWNCSEFWAETSWSILDRLKNRIRQPATIRAGLDICL